MDILGTIIALNWPANKRLFIPIARPTEFDCSSKPVMFHWNVATLPGLMDGVTWSVMDKIFILAWEQARLPFFCLSLARSPETRFARPNRNRNSSELWVDKSYFYFRSKYIISTPVVLRPGFWKLYSIRERIYLVQYLTLKIKEKDRNCS